MQRSGGVLEARLGGVDRIVEQQGPHLGAGGRLELALGDDEERVRLDHGGEDARALRAGEPRLGAGEAVFNIAVAYNIINVKCRANVKWRAGSPPAVAWAGLGAVVVRDIPPNAVVVGNPARRINHPHLLKQAS